MSHQNLSSSESSRRRTRSASALVAVLVSAGLSPAWALTDPAPIVAGVSEVVSVGAVGPIFPVADDWVPVVGGDDDTSFPNLLVVARDYGLGRVLAFGHGGTLVETGVRDNGLFARNAMAWLDVPGAQRIGYSTGHGEWLQDGGANGWAAALAPHGYTAVPVPGPLGATALADVDMLIVGDAWGTIQPAEVEAVRTWVADGHGLLMVGLGWSWDAYHPGAFEDFPMHRLAEPYGVRWARSGIWDPTDNLDGSPVFHTFHPDLTVGGPGDAFAAIDDAHAVYGSTLAATLESDPAERIAFVRAHQTLALVCRELPLGHALRQGVFDGLASVAAQAPDFYSRLGPFDAGSAPTAAWLRERLLRTWVDCLEPTLAVRTQIANALQMSGRRRDVLVELGVALYDNDRLEPWHLDYVYDFLPLVPEGLTHLRGISDVGLLGDPPMPIGLEGMPQAFNIYVSDAAFNQFPPDVSPGVANDTAVVIAHEINHQVDAHAIASDPALRARKEQLVEDAGEDPLNYLRSMIPAGYFAQNPQEFFASIANQWFVDSAKTVDLGVVRFDAGRPDPINQALFFADVYSEGGDTTWFYSTDTVPTTIRQAVILHRNAAGFIDEIDGGEHRYRFTLDAAGRVTDYIRLGPAGGSCATPGDVRRGQIRLVGLDGVAANDSVTLLGRVTLPVPSDPVTDGLRAIVIDAAGAVILDVTVPPGEYDAISRTGWRVGGSGRKWSYRSPVLLDDAIDRAALRTNKKGETSFKLSGRRATVAPSVPALPLTLTVLVEPTAGCARAEFPGPRPRPRCTASQGTRVKCR